MKKLLLLTVICIFFASLQAQNQFTTITGPAKDLKVTQRQAHPGDIGPLSGKPSGEQQVFDPTTIGSTWYDLQSYTNVMQRMWAYPDGTVGASWMSAGEDLNPERGAGYNYYDGVNWGTPNLHVGPADRMGWPCYAPWGPNGEIIALYKYIAGSGPVKFYKRSTKGQGDWIEAALNPPAGVSLVWHSIMTSGENHEFIHVLAYTYDAVYEGQTNALLYYRSSDGAETWEVEALLIDGLGSDYFPTIHSLTYAWANPVGTTIAFTLGFDEWGGWLFKSYDNGDTWENTHVMDTELDPFNEPINSDKIPCGSGNSAIVLDSQGDAHIVFPRMVKLYRNDTLFYYPFTDGLIYWNESMPTLDTTTISSYTFDYLEAGGNLCGWIMSSQPSITIPTDQPTYQNAMCSYPQLSIDSEDNIFVASSNLAPDYTNGTFMYRHIVANSTFDLGNTWEGMIDLNEDVIFIFSECAYPAMAPVIDDYVHVVFQEDQLPGIAVWLEEHIEIQNNLTYMKIEKDLFVGTKEITEEQALSFTISPNPLDANTSISFKLSKPENVAVRIYNNVGQCIYFRESSRFEAGINTFRIDLSHLQAGIYFCRMEYAGGHSTKKMIVH